MFHVKHDENKGLSDVVEVIKRHAKNLGWWTVDEAHNLSNDRDCFDHLLQAETETQPAGGYFEIYGWNIYFTLYFHPESEERRFGVDAITLGDYYDIEVVR